MCEHILYTEDHSYSCEWYKHKVFEKLLHWTAPQCPLVDGKRKTFKQQLFSIKHFN